MAQSLGDMFVSIGADMSSFDQNMKDMQREIRQATAEIRTASAGMTSAFTGVGTKSLELKQRMTELRASSRESMGGMREDMAGVQLEYLNMAQGMKDYQGSNAEFLTELEGLGKRHKKITEQMMINNDALKMGFIQGVGTMLARSGQSEKIASNFERMNNPLYTVNNGLLKVTKSMEGIAKQGTPTVMALKMLGPTANMKELYDMTRLIGTGIMRFQMVALAGVVANALFFSALHKSAMENVPGYKSAVEEMGGAVKKAFEPMVELFAQVMTPIINLITKIAEVTTKFNEAHPVLSKVIAGFFLLVVPLLLILSPLAVGIGLINGMTVSFSSLWVVMSPVVVGLASMVGTVLLVAGALTLLGVGLWALWTKVDWFREGVLKAWDVIKEATEKAWNWVMNNVIKPVLTAIHNFITEMMGKVQKFWDENGASIQKGTETAWGVIKSVIQAVLKAIQIIFEVTFPIIKNIVITVWESMKSIISGALDIILGVIKIFISIFKGDWQGVWDGIKQIASGFIEIVVGLVKLNFIGAIIKGLGEFYTKFKSKIDEIWTSTKKSFTDGVDDVKKSVSDGFNAVVDFITGLGQTFFNAGKGLVEMMASGIRSSVSKVLDEMKDLAKKARDFLPFSPAKTGPLSDLDKLDFGGPIADSITRALPNVQGMLKDLVTLPTIATAGGESVATTGGQNHYWTVEINASDLEEVRNINELLYTLQQQKRARGGK